MDVVLVRVTKNGSTTPIPLVRDKTLVGRLDDCHIRVPVAGMSRKHCEIVIEDGSIIVNDLGSSNGTFVNQDQISSQPVSAGDLISFGGFVFVVTVNGLPDDINSEIMFEDGLPVSNEVLGADSAPAAAPAVPQEPVIQKVASVVDNDDSSMMDFEFEFDDDDDQPPL